MVSSLAAQLAQNSSLNASILVDRTRRKPTESYLFTGKDADQYDLDSLYALAVNGFLQLQSLNPSLGAYEDALFSNAAKATDRTLLTAEAIAELDASISSCLQALGPYLLDAPTGKVLEWLVRRFRINEFNVEAILALFLPYHETPHFAKMNTILHIKPNTTWSFLLPFKSAAQSVPRIALVSEMTKNTVAARFIASLLPKAIEEERAHRTLIAFNAATLHDFIMQSKSLDEGTLAYLLPALIEPLGTESPKEAILGSYVLIAALSHKCSLTPAALKAFLVAMISRAHQVGVTPLVNALISVCEPQEVLDELPSSTVKAFLRVKNVEQEVREALGWEGSEKLILPMLGSVIRRLKDDSTTDFVETLITTPNVHQDILRRLTALLLERAVAPEPLAPANRLLHDILQRHPTAYRAVVDELSQREDEALKVNIEQLTITLTMGYTTPKSTSESIDAIVASSNADEKLRVNAVKTLLEKVSDADPSEVDALHSAILSRIQDTNQAVLEALYATNPSALLKIALKNSQLYIENLNTTLSSTAKPKRAILKLHLGFLADQFLSKTDSDKDISDAFHKIFFPFLLYSKPRQHTADLVWDILGQWLGRLKGSVVVGELLNGCDEVRKGLCEDDQNDGDAAERMVKLNALLTAKIAENILSSNMFSEHLTELVKKLQDSNAHVRIFGYFIAKALLSRMSGQHQVDAAQLVLDTLNGEQITSVDDSDDDVLEIVENAGRNIIGKPNGRNSMSWVQLSVLKTIAEIVQPDGVVVDFITSLPKRHSDDRGYRYTKLMRHVYRLSNSLGPNLKKCLLSTLFVTLKSDALLFFAGVWLSDFREKDSSALKRLALNHAQTFLEAAAEDNENAGVDFQTVVPSILVVLRDHNADVRKAAVALLGLIKKTTAEKKFGTVYAFDLVYGSSENPIQYLSQDELRKYMSALIDHVEHFLYDPDYIRVFHKDHLSKARGDSKKETSYKHNVLCYLLAHVNAMTQPSAQYALLDTVGDISDKAKAETLLPTIETLVSDSTAEVMSQIYGSYVNDIARLVAFSFDLSISQELNEKPKLWEIFLALTRASVTSGLISSVRSTIADKLKSGLFSKLKREKKVELCLALVEQSIDEDTTVHTYVKSLLSSILDEAVVITQLLDALRSGILDGGSRAIKRAKVDDAPDDVMLRLGLVAEVLGSMQLPGSFDLISHLLETLSKVMQSTNAIRADAIFIEQSLMSAVDNAAGKVKEIPNLAPNAIRLDVLVELIRITDNPQTFHQALLLIANLARLAPESVLHNIMPVFTFMGSNIFHRDDAYSFAVVQKTVDSIVPVMVSSLKRSHTSRLELYIASRDFLRVFTDAANHIPRHRRTNFFAHLVDVLGPADFLAPICLLLIEKSTNKIIRQNAEEVLSVLALPISLLHHYSPSLQISALVEMIRESERLADRASGDTSQATLLDDSLSEEHSLSPSVVYRRRSQAIITFSAYSAKSFPSEMITEDGGTLSDLVALLISLATKKGGSHPEAGIDDINKTARFAMDKLLSVVSATDYIAAVLSMLSSGDQLVQTGALDLLSSRLPRVSGTVRQAATTSVTQIIETVKKLFSQNPPKSFSISAFNAIRAVGMTMNAGEESCVTSLVPTMLVATRDRALAVAAMSALASLPEKLGPRFIPFFRDTVTQAVAGLRSSEDVLIRQSTSLLQGLLVSIPTFWSANEICQVFKVFLDFSAQTQQLHADVVSLVKAITKKSPAKVLLPAVCDMWMGVGTVPQTDALKGYLDILKRSIRNAARATVQENLKQLFNVFVGAFEVIKSQNVTKGNAKEQAISAFIELVIKLNEPTFRPLFRRLYDWSFVGDNDLARKVTFCQLYSGLLDYFKNLMNPYMAMLMTPLLGILKDYINSETDSRELLVAVLETLGKSISCDDGGFWRDEKLRQLTPSLISLIPVCVRLDVTEAKVLLRETLSSAVEHVTDDTLLKSVNLDILMHTRSEDAGTRIFALSVSESLWKTHGGKLLGFVAETATFIAECCEDEHDTVARESFKLKDAVESVAGSINGI